MGVMDHNDPIGEQTDGGEGREEEKEKKGKEAHMEQGKQFSCGHHHSPINKISPHAC